MPRHRAKVATMFPRSLLLLALVAGCSGDDTSADDGGNDQIVDTDDTEPQGLCGDVTYWDLTITGRVRSETGGAAPGATVTIEDRVWVPGTIYGTATTDGTGTFTIAVTDLVSVEDCWGMLGYYAVAELGNLSGEAGINSALFTAIDTGSLVADLSAVPIDLEEPATP